MNEEGKWVAYFRVSTTRQGESGLGLEAQKSAVESFLHGRGEILAEFVEIESGKKVRRPQLDEALKLCRKMKATLVIAKLDRLARNVHFISGLMESRVDFRAVDSPAKDRFILHIQAAFAEEEARRISERTKAALAAAKARGVAIGETGRQRAVNLRREANDRAETLRCIVEDLRFRGITSVRGIRDEMNKLSVPSPGGGKWHLPNTQRLLQRLRANGATLQPTVD
jgi:DNA invertase Pin-like site-specific DNA recombinase